MESLFFYLNWGFFRWVEHLIFLIEGEIFHRKHLIVHHFSWIHFSNQSSIVNENLSIILEKIFFFNWSMKTKIICFFRWAVNRLIIGWNILWKEVLDRHYRRFCRRNLFQIGILFQMINQILKQKNREKERKCRIFSIIDGKIHLRLVVVVVVLHLLVSVMAAVIYSTDNPFIDISLFSRRFSFLSLFDRRGRG